jgi:hypothetical protein
MFSNIMRNILPSVVVFFAGLYIALFTIDAYYNSIDSAGTVSRIAPAAGDASGVEMFNGFDETFVPEEEEGEEEILNEGENLDIVK